MKRAKELMMDGGRAFRLRKKPSSMEDSCNGAACLPPNLLVMNSEHNDRPKQTKKREVKLKWLIRKIPRGGAKAAEILVAI
jgi:hypothetical protein